jgi:hypothetical protein
MMSPLKSTALPLLGGLKVLESSVSDSFAESLLSMILADQGASVAKIGLDAANAPEEDAPARETERLVALADLVILPAAVLTVMPKKLEDDD